MPRSNPAVALDPASDLVDGTAVTVAATGLAPDVWVMAVQCIAGAQEPYADCDAADASYTLADASGAATLTLKVDARPSPPAASSPTTSP